MTEEEVQLAFVKYFVGLCTSKNARNLIPCLQPLNSQVTKAMNSSLLQPFIAEEVLFAFHHMASLKALGPDGFPVEFF